MLRKLFILVVLTIAWLNHGAAWATTYQLSSGSAWSALSPTPGASDGIYLNGQNLTFNSGEGATYSCGTLAASSSANTITAGSLQFSNSALTLNATTMLSGTATFFTIAGSNTITFGGSMKAGANSAGTANMAGGTLNIGGNVNGGSATTGRSIVQSGGLLTLTGTATGGSATSANAIYMTGGTLVVPIAIGGTGGAQALGLAGGLTKMGSGIYGSAAALLQTGGTLVGISSGGGGGAAITIAGTPSGTISSGTLYVAISSGTTGYVSGGTLNVAPAAAVLSGTLTGFAGSSGSVGTYATIPAASYTGTYNSVAGTITGSYSNGTAFSIAGSGLLSGNTVPSGSGTKAGGLVLSSGSQLTVSSFDSSAGTLFTGNAPLSGQLTTNAGTLNIGGNVISPSFTAALPQNYVGTAGTGTVGTLSGCYSNGTAFSIAGSGLLTGNTVPSGTGTKAGGLVLSSGSQLVVSSFDSSAGTLFSMVAGPTISGSNIIVSSGTANIGGQKVIPSAYPRPRSETPRPRPRTREAPPDQALACNRLRPIVAEEYCHAA